MLEVAPPGPRAASPGQRIPLRHPASSSSLVGYYFVRIAMGASARTASRERHRARERDAVEQFTGWEADLSSPLIRNEIWHEGIFRAIPPAPLSSTAVAPPTVCPGPSSPTFFAVMEAFQPADLITAEVTHAQSRPTDLVAGHVGPAPAIANAPARKRQGNIVVQAGIPAGPAGREGASRTAATLRSGRPPAGKMNKVLGVKRKKVATKKPSATAGEVFDEMLGSRGLNNAATEFVHLLATNLVDINQAPISGFNYNELEGGVDDHGGEDEVEDIDEGTYQQSQGKKRQIK
ncbi:galacturonosyltransferase 14 [Hordeum vulgare]|nr:galacturonosyltransferase 14 [Hordeum vulgare]